RLRWEQLRRLGERQRSRPARAFASWFPPDTHHASSRRARRKLAAYRAELVAVGHASRDLPMRLIEPVGLLSPHVAGDAVAAGIALPLAGGGAFTAARLIDRETRLVATRDLPAEWRPEAARLAAPPPPWAGLPCRPSVMGIINVTPDSFSDGGRHFDAGRAAARAAEMVAAGAAMLDVGAESTRPGAAPVTPEEERRRLLPVLARLVPLGVPVSVDTRNAGTMAAA